MDAAVYAFLILNLISLLCSFSICLHNALNRNFYSMFSMALISLSCIHLPNIIFYCSQISLISTTCLAIQVLVAAGMLFRGFHNFLASKYIFIILKHQQDSIEQKSFYRDLIAVSAVIIALILNCFLITLENDTVAEKFVCSRSIPQTLFLTCYFLPLICLETSSICVNGNNVTKL